MNLKEAQEKIDNHKNIIGKMFDGREISELVVVPANGDLLGEIIAQVHFGNSYFPLLFGYSDFTVIVLLDLDDFSNSGVLLRDSLDNALKYLKIQN